MVDVFYIFGILGLFCIIIGILIKNKNRKARDVIYIVGGILLTTYSFYIGDGIFLLLQIIFTLVAAYDLTKQINAKRGRK